MSKIKLQVEHGFGRAKGMDEFGNSYTTFEVDSFAQQENGFCAECGEEYCTDCVEEIDV